VLRAAAAVALPLEENKIRPTALHLRPVCLTDGSMLPLASDMHLRILISVIEISTYLEMLLLSSKGGSKAKKMMNRDVSRNTMCRTEFKEKVG